MDDLSDPGAKLFTEIQPQLWMERFKSSDGQRFEPQLLCRTHYSRMRWLETCNRPPTC